MDLNSLRLALCQLQSTDDFSLNFKTLSNLLCQGEAELYCFPENSIYMKLNNSEKIKGFELDSNEIRKISHLAQESGKDILLGSIPLLEKSKVSNATVLISQKGAVDVVYRKLHLFDIDLDDGTSFRESNDFDPGKELGILEYKDWKIGLSICFDLRFPELYVHYYKQNVDALFIPAAFTVPTGKAHWSLLLRARAIEGQCYVVAPAQGGSHRGLRETWGHSMIVGPWGEVLAEMESRPGVQFVELKKSEVERVRKQVPRNVSTFIL